jgi:integral membrane sensor domain MASE1
MAATCSTAARNAASLAFDGLLKPLTFLTNCSEALIGAALVRAFVPGPLRLDSLRTVWIFLACGALAADVI